MAAQEQALNTNSVTNQIYHLGDSNKCRLCGIRVESVTHIVSACQMLAQKEYKRRHDKVCLYLHWTLCRKYGYDANEKWYHHVPERVLDEEGKPKILWDFAIQTDRKLDHNRPDILVYDRKTNECQIIDVAVPGDQNINTKEVEKITNYSELKIEIARMWSIPAKSINIIPIVIGALGSIPKKLEGYLKQLGAEKQIPLLQKTALLGTAHILRKVLAV